MDEKVQRPESAEDFLMRLGAGGAIVSSNDLSAEDISKARADGRLWVDRFAYGYVYLPLE